MISVGSENVRNGKYQVNSPLNICRRSLTILRSRKHRRDTEADVRGAPTKSGAIRNRSLGFLFYISGLLSQFVHSPILCLQFKKKNILRKTTMYAYQICTTPYKISRTEERVRNASLKKNVEWDSMRIPLLHAESGSLPPHAMLQSTCGTQPLPVSLERVRFIFSWLREQAWHICASSFGQQSRTNTQ